MLVVFSQTLGNLKILTLSWQERIAVSQNILTREKIFLISNSGSGLLILFFLLILFHHWCWFSLAFLFHLYHPLTSLWLLYISSMLSLLFRYNLVLTKTYNWLALKSLLYLCVLTNPNIEIHCRHSLHVIAITALTDLHLVIGFLTMLVRLLENLNLLKSSPLPST